MTFLLMKRRADKVSTPQCQLRLPAVLFLCDGNLLTWTDHTHLIWFWYMYNNPYHKPPLLSWTRLTSGRKYRDWACKASSKKTHQWPAGLLNIFDFRPNTSKIKKFSGTFCARTCCKLQILFWSYSSKVLNPAKHFSFLLLVEVKLWHLNGLPRHIPNTGALFLRISVFDIPVFKFWVNSFLLNITLPSQLEPTCRMQCPTGFKMRRDSRDSCWQFYYMMHVFHISLDYKTNYKPHWFWATFILL